MTKQECQSEKNKLWQRKRWRLPSACMEYATSSWVFLCFYMFWPASSHKRGDWFGWKLQQAYGAAPSDSWHLIAHGDQPLLSNKLPGPETWHRHLVSCWQWFAPPVPAVTQSPYRVDVPKVLFPALPFILFPHPESVQSAGKLDVFFFKPVTSSFTFCTLPCLRHS